MTTAVPLNLRSLGRLLPPRTRHALKKLYYPRLIRRFDPARWPPSAITDRIVSPGDHVVDAGANIGYVTALLARRVGSEGLVDAVEPVPATYDLLAHNVRALGLANVRTHPVGLAARNTEAWMEIPAFEDGRENLYESKVVDAADASAETGSRVSVQLRRLDTLLAQRTRPVTFVKIDVEGHELQAVEGAQEVLRDDRPALLIEVSGDPDAQGSNAARLFDRLAGMGYEPWTQSGDDLRPRRSGDRSVDYFFLTPALARKLGFA